MKKVGKKDMYRKTVMFSVSMVLFLSTTIAQSWTQVGEDIFGEADDDDFGSSVSLSANGSVVAVGAAGNDGYEEQAGHVRVLQNIEGNWIQLGQDIDGEVSGDGFGSSVSLNSDGSIVAAGAVGNDENGEYAGQVRVFQNIGGDWIQMGQKIMGESAGDACGFSVSINSDGSILAVSSVNNGEFAGQVRVFQYNSGNWMQIGDDINGEEAGDNSGWSVSLNSSGNIVAIGAPLNDGNEFNSGHVRIYQNISGSWAQIGNDIDGEGYHDLFGCSVSLNSEGSVVAIGAILNGGSGFESGHVRIYQNIDGTWTQVGEDIDGEYSNDRSGCSVSLSSDGSVVAVGAHANRENGNYAGHARVYQYVSGACVQIGDDIDGKDAEDFFGESLCLSSSNYTILVGAPSWGDTGPGYVNIYKYEVSGIEEIQNNKYTIYPNPTSGKIKVSINNHSYNQNLTLTDITGKSMMEKNLKGQNETIDISALERGMYIICIEDGKKLFRKKILKK